METLVATVLLVVIFIVASLVMNNWLENSTRHSMSRAEAELLHLQYVYEHEGIEVPYQEENEGWVFSVFHEVDKSQNSNHSAVEVVFTAESLEGNRSLEMRHKPSH